MVHVLWDKTVFSVPDFCNLGGSMEVFQFVDTLQVFGSAGETVGVSGA